MFVWIIQIDGARKCKLKTALCLYGQPRFIDNPNIKQTVNEKILSRENVDVYGHFWYDEKIQQFHGSDWHNTPTKYYQGGSFYVPTNVFDNIKNNYNLENLNNFVYESPRDFSGILNQDEHNLLSNKTKNSWDQSNYYSQHNVNSLLSHLYSIETALNLIPTNTYDFIILTRYDAIVLNFPMLSILERKFIYLTSNLNDNMIIIDGDMLNGLKCYSNIKNIINQIKMWIAEYIKLANIEYFYGKNAISSKNIGDRMVSIVRSKTDCQGQ